MEENQHHNQRQSRHEVEFPEVVFHLQKAFEETDDEPHQREPHEKIPDQTQQHSHRRVDEEPSSFPLHQFLRPHQLRTPDALSHDDAEDGRGKGSRHHDRRFIQKPHRTVHHFAAVSRRRRSYRRWCSVAVAGAPVAVLTGVAAVFDRRTRCSRSCPHWRGCCRRSP